MCERLRARRWTWRVLDQAGVGWDGQRFTIPQRNARGELVGVVRYTDRPGRLAKSLAIKDTRREFTPRPELVRSSRLWLVEGEPDALALLSAGVPAVGIPGCAGWRPEWATRFAGRFVIVCCDCDAAGRKAAQRVAGDLDRAGAESAICDIDPERDDGYDLTDFLRDVAAGGGNAINALVALTEEG